MEFKKDNLEKTFIEFLKPETGNLNKATTMAVGEEGGNGNRFEALFDEDKSETINVPVKNDFKYTTMSTKETGGKFDTLFPKPENGDNLEIDKYPDWYNKEPSVTTCAMGEEGGYNTLFPEPKPGKEDILDTLKPGKDNITTMAMGEEGGSVYIDPIEMGQSKFPWLDNEQTVSTMALGEEGGVNIGDIGGIDITPEPIVQPSKKSAKKKLSEVKNQILNFAKANPRPNPDKLTIPTDDVEDVQTFLKEVQNLLDKNYPSRFKAEITNETVKNDKNKKTQDKKEKVEIKPTKKKKKAKKTKKTVKYISEKLDDVTSREFFQKQFEDLMQNDPSFKKYWLEEEQKRKYPYSTDV